MQNEDETSSIYEDTEDVEDTIYETDEPDQIYEHFPFKCSGD